MQQLGERRERFALLAQAVLVVVCKDAMPGSRASDEERRFAQDFILSEDAQMWAQAARLDFKPPSKINPD